MKKRDLNRRKEGIVQVQMYKETAAIFKDLAAKAVLTLPNYFKRLCEEVTGTETGSTVQREHEARVLKGNFRETGKGKPKPGLEAFTFEGKEYHFRLLDTYNEKDLELLKSWDMQKRMAYAEWWDFKHPVESQKCNRHFMGEFEWESSYKRCSM